MRASRISRFIIAMLTAAMTAGCATSVVASQSLTILPPKPAAAATPAAPAAVTAAVAPAAAKPRDTHPLQTRLAEYLSAQDGTYGVFFIDMKTGNTVGYNSDTVFPTASTFKLPLAMCILDLAAKGRVSLDERLAYSQVDWEEGTGVLQGAVKVGDRYTVRQLVELAITESDNIATNMLVRRFGPQNVYTYMQRLGGKVTHFEAGVPGTTPREMAEYLRAATGSQAVGDKALREFLFGALSTTSFHTRIEAGLPDGVKVAHKIGTLPGVVNDVALVYAPGRQFILAAYSMEVDEETAEAVIARVAEMVYAHVQAID